MNLFQDVLLVFFVHGVVVLFREWCAIHESLQVVFWWGNITVVDVSFCFVEDHEI